MKTLITLAVLLGMSSSQAFAVVMATDYAAGMQYEVTMNAMEVADTKTLYFKSPDSASGVSKGTVTGIGLFVNTPGATSVSSLNIVSGLPKPGGGTDVFFCVVRLPNVSDAQSLLAAISGASKIYCEGTSPGNQMLATQVRLSTP